MNDTYINYIDQLLDLAERNDIFRLSSRAFNEFESEVREALEKQKQRKPKDREIEYVCRTCDTHVAYADYYCWHCGQKLDLVN